MIDIPPQMARVIQALRSIGYQMPQAIADIIDNSVDAQADIIVIRFILNTKGSLDLSIWDNGSGMAKPILQEAMRIGSDTDKDSLQLGKFGMGLKLASLSQAPMFDVVSHEAGGEIYGLRATVSTLSENKVAELRQDYCMNMLTKASSGKNASSGTVVTLLGLDRLNLNEKLSEKIVTKMSNKLRSHLGLIYHRHLAQNKIKILVETNIEERGSPYPPESIHALNPFGYPHSGHDQYPKDFIISIGDSQIRARVHIWPPNCQSREYKLPGGANTRQGLYIFRNNRLLQAGGWNGMRESEPHLSLCRVEIDLPSTLDDLVRLDIKKSSIDLPEEFFEQIMITTSKGGTKFNDCLTLANTLYRSSSSKPNSKEAVLPSGEIKSFYRTLLADHKGIKTKDSDDIEIFWKKLNKDEMFRIDRGAGQILISTALKDSMKKIPLDELFPLFLFLLLEDYLVIQRSGLKANNKIKFLQKILLTLLDDNKSDAI